MNRRCATSLIGALCVVLAACQSRSKVQAIPTAEELRAKALQQAKQQNKHVLLWFSTGYDDLSRRLERFHADPDVSAVLDQYFVEVQIDVHETPGGEQLYLETGSDRGTPAFSILDFNGALLADSGGDEATNIGYPTQPHELDAYCAALRTACPQLTDEELALLRLKLVEFR